MFDLIVFVFVSIGIRFDISIHRHRIPQQRLNQHQPNNHELKHSKSTDGTRTNQTKSHTCKSIKSIWMTVHQWCWTHCWKSKMKLIQRWHSDDRVAKASAAHAPWTLAAQIHWPASAKSIQIWVNRVRSIRCRTCMWCAIWYPTWATFINNTPQSSRGCRESKRFFSFFYKFINYFRDFYQAPLNKFPLSLFFFNFQFAYFWSAF